MFRFVQWELPGAIGPGTGRYVLRPVAGEGPEQVLVLRAAEAPRKARRLASHGGGRRGRGVAPEPQPAPLDVTLATVIEAAPFDGEDEAAGWLERAAGADEIRETAATALRSLNLAVEAHRVAAADPYVNEIAPEHATVTRVGYGSGEQVAEGRWTEAREVPRADPAARSRREAVLRPQERLAALLGGRDAALACEEMSLRARLDLDHGRGREAALQTHLALEAARVELAAWGSLTGMADRLGDLDERREAVAAAANAALQGGLPEAERATVAAALERVEAALRARTAAGAY